MAEGDWLVERFQTHRAHLRAVAYRMLGSLSEADDAVQEAWLRLSRAGSGGVDDLGRWLTTVVARVCLDMLRSRAARREEPLGVHLPDPIIGRPDAPDPEQEALLGDAVGLALLVVLEELAPAERLALVLHDTLAVPFEEIAAILGRSPACPWADMATSPRGRRRSAAVPAGSPGATSAGSWPAPAWASLTSRLPGRHRVRDRDRARRQPDRRVPGTNEDDCRGRHGPTVGVGPVRRDAAAVHRHPRSQGR